MEEDRVGGFDVDPGMRIQPESACSREDAAILSPYVMVVLGEAARWRCAAQNASGTARLRKTLRVAHELPQGVSPGNRPAENGASLSRCSWAWRNSQYGRSLDRPAFCPDVRTRGTSKSAVQLWPVPWPRRQAQLDRLAGHPARRARPRRAAARRRARAGLHCIVVALGIDVHRSQTRPGRASAKAPPRTRPCVRGSDQSAEPSASAPDRSLLE